MHELQPACARKHLRLDERVDLPCGADTEREFAFGVARQLFEAELVALEPRERAVILDGAAALAAPVVSGGPIVTDPGDRRPRAEEATFTRLHGLYWLVSNFADRRPLLLAVDDAHWSDRGSARFLGYLTGRLEGLRVLLVVVVRPGEGGSDTLIAGLGEERVGVLRPRPLADVAVAELVRRDLSEAADDEFCAACRRVSAGNPFLLASLIDELREENVAPVSASVPRLAKVKPPAIARAVLARLARLGPRASDLRTNSMLE